MVRSAASTILVLLAVSNAVHAADIEVRSFECDGDLPITASSLDLDCYPHDGYCALGQDVTIEASMTYSGVSSVTSNYKAYTKTRIGLEIGYPAVSKVAESLTQVNLCAWAHSGNGGCPADGSYTLKATHTLPSMGDKDWFLTGQHFVAELMVYADESGSEKIADCKAHLTTRVTNASSQNNFYNVPSAGKVAFISAIVVAVSILGISLGCWWIDHREVELKQVDSDFEILGDDPVSQSRRRDYDYA